MKYLKKTTWLPVLCLALSSSVWADDASDAIEKAATLYKEGQTQQAITQLELATQLIRQQRAEAMQQVLPEPLDGWTAEAATSTSAGAAMLGGGSTIKRTYSKADKNLSIEIVADSPMIQGMMAIFSNPMFGAASQGGKVQMVNGQQAILKDDGLMMVVENTFMVQINADKGMEADVIAYASAIDLKKLSGFK
ncbi:hypothetical protein SAMN05660964_01938 [Thiothrix caldifontis]|uniref:Uncharacterized protein n=1 Tax=Thiothrix caldifontis TaxID=525918 RepID=A0A1H4CHM5_9GAMM|nr:hypothetical protein [Thiothrix caldifontis]SEA59562.1 hypothetical protein SAMN05660964_01938 [Thiothrix caldifontis]